MKKNHYPVKVLLIFLQILFALLCQSQRGEREKRARSMLWARRRIEIGRDNQIERRWRTHDRSERREKTRTSILFFFSQQDWHGLSGRDFLKTVLLIHVFLTFYPPVSVSSSKYFSSKRTRAAALLHAAQRSNKTLSRFVLGAAVIALGQIRPQLEKHCNSKNSID